MDNEKKHAYDITVYSIYDENAQEEGKKYKIAYAPVPVQNAAKFTRSVPKEYIAKNGHDVTEAFLEYVRPIVGEIPHCEIF